MWKKLKGSVVKKLHSLDKKLYFVVFIWCANLTKHLVNKGKQHISKETEQLAHYKIKTISICNELPHLPYTGLWIIPAPTASLFVWFKKNFTHKLELNGPITIIIEL